MTETDEPDDEGEALAELCDRCGTTISDRTELYALVPDSSVTHAHDPRLDGRRMVTACSQEHMSELVEQYKARPFVSAELWAGQIYRAMSRYPEGISAEALAEETGLTPGQIELGALWQNLGALRWHERYGRGNGPQTE